jgi:hypothetical protein
VTFEADYPQGGIARWRAFFQWVVAIPHFIALGFLMIGAFFAIIVAFFATLLTGGYPRGLFDFLAGVLRWSWRVNGFLYLMTEEYPPFSLGEEPSYPMRLRIQPPQKIARWRPLVHWLFAIPHYVVLYLMTIGAYFVLFFAWLAVLFTRSYPPALFNYMAGYMRWQARYAVYVLWMTEEYPPFGFG